MWGMLLAEVALLAALVTILLLPRLHGYFVRSRVTLMLSNFVAGLLDCMA
jgi:hypothetical protein